MVYSVLLCLLSMPVIYFAISYKRVTIGTSNLLNDAPEEITVQLGNGESYEITKETFVIDHDQFLPEYSVVNYPTIKFSDDTTMIDWAKKSTGYSMKRQCSIMMRN